MFVDNMNRRDTGWTVGDCIDGVETLINYDHDFCIDALTRQASEFGTEYEIEGKRVSLKRSSITNRTLSRCRMAAVTVSNRASVVPTAETSRRRKSCLFRAARRTSTEASTGTENSSSRKDRQSVTMESISRARTVSSPPTPEPMSWTIWVSQSVEPTNSRPLSQKIASTHRRSILRGSGRLRLS